MRKPTQITSKWKKQGLQYARADSARKAFKNEGIIGMAWITEPQRGSGHIHIYLNNVWVLLLSYLRRIFGYRIAVWNSNFSTPTILPYSTFELLQSLFNLRHTGHHASPCLQLNCGHAPSLNAHMVLHIWNTQYTTRPSLTPAPTSTSCRCFPNTAYSYLHQHR